jgi:integrase
MKEIKMTVMGNVALEETFEKTQEPTIEPQSTNVRQLKSNYIHRKSDGAEYIKPTAGDPIRSKADLKAIYKYFEDGRSSQIETLNARNYAIFILGISTGLRISDLLKIKVRDIIDLRKLNAVLKSKPKSKITKEDDIFVDRIYICEQKTGKINKPVMSKRCKVLIFDYLKLVKKEVKLSFTDYLWVAGGNRTSVKVVSKPIAMQNYYDVLKKISNEIEFETPTHLSTHSMRKTFGYWLFKNASSQAETLAILQELFNHSNQRVTLRYIGITEDTKLKTLAEFSNLLDDILE